MSETATDRLARVLGLVPYISRRPGVALADLAVEFGVSTEQISADLDLLMVCGLPGYYPDDLIDVVLDEEGGTVSIAFDAGIERPVRLTSDEAVALTVALRAFADLPGLVDADAVYSALAKLEQAGAQTADAVRVSAADAAPALGAVRQAIDESRQIWMRYYTASRDALTERIVDPIRLLVTDGHSYLEGYCHAADAVRHFRVDRIEEIRVLDEPAQGQLWVDSDIPEKMFHPDPQIPPVTLRLEPAARWVAEYYQTEDAVELPVAGRGRQPVDGRDGGLRVRLRGGGDEWLVRLVLSLGGSAVIEDRPDLAVQVAERAAQALAAYR
ncbi:proteasome accessory factor C [Nakamurella panacisegetis]|uniref:Proteasome accessory factor C n=1 Tax=Nakamurella panacisegetis TaxID=1090615 RepID=A0A1H0RSS0_9ACTN|nr:WYL domain-containing protein [Nakamurella panacisegetis]SDP32507.1 proteasome accessory factor C [Nakamurella panacisegetis]